MTQPPWTGGPVPTRPARTGRPPVDPAVAIGVGAVLWAVGWLFVALALQAGYDAVHAEYTGTPVCDGQRMRPGDSCIVWGNGGGESGTYEEIVTRNERDARAEAWAWVEAEGALGAALLFFGLATVGLHGRLRAKVNAWLFTCLAGVWSCCRWSALKGVLVSGSECGWSVSCRVVRSWGRFQ